MDRFRVAERERFYLAYRNGDEGFAKIRPCETLPSGNGAGAFWFDNTTLAHRPRLPSSATDDGRAARHPQVNRKLLAVRSVSLAFCSTMPSWPSQITTSVPFWNAAVSTAPIDGKRSLSNATRSSDTFQSTK